MNERVKRTVQIVLSMTAVASTGFLYQWVQEAPSWEAATERGYFQAIMVPICYWLFKVYGWIKT